MLVDSERNLDLLFGILVFAGWNQSHLHPLPIITNLVQLAIAVIADLGLNKPLTKSPQHTVLSYNARGCQKPVRPSKRTMEERRAVIGVFWLSSMVSTYFERIDSLRWTPYLDECLNMLAENQECSSDLLLSYLVRLQILYEKSCEATWHDHVDGSRSPNSITMRFYMQALLSQFEEVKKSIIPELQQSQTLLLSLYSTEHSIYEIAMAAPSPSDVLDYKHTEALLACLSATKKWFELAFQIPPAMYIAFSMAMFTQIAHAIITLYRLSTFEGVDWDRGLAKETAEFSATLKTFIGKMRQVKSAAGLDVGVAENVDVYFNTANRLQTINDWWEAKVATEVAPPTMNTEVRDECLANSIDDAWLKEIFGMEEYQFESYIQTI
jgi:hypothetical protein